MYTDSNALRALQGVGVLEPMLAQENLTTLHQRHFLFVSETGEQVYDVSIINFTCEISSKSDSMLNMVRQTWGLESIGIHISLILL